MFCVEVVMSNAKSPTNQVGENIKASFRSFPPPASVKCDGSRLFRSQVARDAACILDVNPDISTWTCMPTSLGIGAGRHVPDFGVLLSDGISYLVDAPDRLGLVDPSDLKPLAALKAWRYRLMDQSEVYDGFRLKNARDLLKYGAHVAALGDRVRLLAALDEHGSLPFAECLKAFREGAAVAGLASLILNGFVQVELDDAPIGPETLVRRIPM
jgi:hypothetical protein